MKRWISIVLPMLGLAAVAFAQSGIRFQGQFTPISEVEATVISVTHLDFPNARVRLRIEDSRRYATFDLRRGSQDIEAENYLVETRGRINYQNQQNINSMAAYYLVPGDRITAKLFRHPSQRNRWYVYGILRMSPPRWTGSDRDESRYDDLRLSLDTDNRSYTLNRTVNMKLRVTNMGNRAKRLDFRSAQQYDFIVSRDGREVWRWSRNRAFTQALTSLAVNPGQTVTFSESWNQMDNNGRRVSEGEYEITAMLTEAPGREMSSRPVIIEIRR